jgi:hypothetical protein
VADRHPDSDHPDHLVAGRAARLMTRARKPVTDLERRPGGNPGRRAVRASAPAVAAANKQPRRARLERWDERFVVALAFVLAAIVVLMTIYQTIGWARS